MKAKHQPVLAHLTHRPNGPFRSPTTLSVPIDDSDSESLECDVCSFRFVRLFLPWQFMFSVCITRRYTIASLCTTYLDIEATGSAQVLNGSRCGTCRCPHLRGTGCNFSFPFAGWAVKTVSSLVGHLQESVFASETAAESAHQASYMVPWWSRWGRSLSRQNVFLFMN